MKNRMIMVLGVAVATSLALASCGSSNPSSAIPPTMFASGTSTSSAQMVVIPPLVLGGKVSFGAPKSPMLTKGWGFADAGGTWTDAKVATMDIVVSPSYTKSLTLALNSLPFLSKSHNSIQVEVMVNSVKIDNLIYKTTDKTNLRNLVVPATILTKGAGHLKFTFKIQNPASPQSLGLSTDPRMLGIWAISLELTKAS